MTCLTAERSQPSSRRVAGRGRGDLWVGAQKGGVHRAIEGIGEVHLGPNGSDEDIWKCQCASFLLGTAVIGCSDQHDGSSSGLGEGAQLALLDLVPTGCFKKAKAGTYPEHSKQLGPRTSLPTGYNQD
ncbi:MAG: hypothetical protein FRX49_08172 [Trebouxia sp. A1-2]|nr:MAG: hypothetical protein FRX49_08172 [Trebouxia sp. A1-2]